MADLLPDIPADLFNNWSADQFAQAAQEKIATLPGDIATGVQNLLGPPPPPPEPAPVPEPQPPPPEPPPAPAPAPAPDLAPPPPPPTSAPETVVPPAPAGPPPDLSSPQQGDLQPASYDDLVKAGWQQVQGGAQAAGQAAQTTAASYDDLVKAGWQQVQGGAQAAGQQAGQPLASMQDLLDNGWQIVQQGAQQATQVVGQAAQAVQQAPQSLGIQGPTPKTPGDLIDQTRQAAINAGIDPDIFARQIQQESGFRPDAGSPAGAQGIAQFMPATAKQYGVNPWDPSSALPGAAKMMRDLLDQYNGNWNEALAAYNGGDRAVQRLRAGTPWEETQGYLNNILGGAKDVVQNAATQGQTAINNATQAAQGAVARTSQFAMGLSSGDAMAFCGPAAAMAFAQSFGRNPTVEEAKQLAQQVGWNPDQGMAGPSSEVSLLNALGIASHMTTGVDWGKVASDATSGNPVIIDTPGHYFYVDGYNADTGQFHFGSSATDLKASGGQEWFTPDQMAKLGMGAARAAIFADHPLTPGGVAASVAQGVSTVGQDASSLLSQGWQIVQGGAQNVASQAQDTLNAVMATGTSTMQDALSGAGQAAQDLGQGVQGIAQDALSGAGQAAQDLGQGVQDIGAFMQGQQELARQGRAQYGLPEDALLAPIDLSNPGANFGVDPYRDIVQQGVPSIVRGVQEGNVGDVLGGALQTILGAASVLPGGGGPSVNIPPTIYAQAADLLGDPTVQAALRYRQAAQSDVNAALGGLPSVFGVGGTLPTTGAGQLQRALDALAAYPEEVSGPIRQFAASTDAPASEVANTVLRWVQDNPLHAMPDITAPAAAVRDVGRQAVADIADMVRTGGGRGPYLPSGAMPGQLGLGLPETSYQPRLAEGLGTPGGLPQVGLSTGEQQWLQNLRQAATQRDFAGMQSALEQAGLLGDRTGTTLAAQPFSRGGAAEFTQDVLPGFNPRDPVSLRDWFNLLHTGSVTAGAGTLSKVFFNSLLQPAWNLGTRGIYDLATGNPGRVAGQMAGITDAFSQAGKDALLGIRDAYIDPSAISTRTDNPIAQAIARAFESPMNVHAALQDFNQTFGSLVELRRLAGQQAQNEGLLPFSRAWQDRYAELLQNPPPGLQEAADAVGKRLAMRGELGGWGELINKVVKSNDNGGQSMAGNTLWPVFRIGWNGAVQRVEKSPLGLLAPTGTIGDVIRGMAGYGPYAGAKPSELIPALRNQLTPGGSPIQTPFNYPVQKGVTPLAERFANNISGTATGLLTAAIASALAGKGLVGAVTGSGPVDKATRDQLTAGGWLPNALRTGLGYMDYTNLPGSETLSLIGNLMDAVNYPTQTEARDVAAGRTAGVPDWVYQLEGRQPVNAAVNQSAWRLAQHVGQSLGSEAGLRQIADIADLVYGRTAPGSALANTAGSTLGGFVPWSGALRSAALAGDVAQRLPEPGNVLQAIEQNIPGLRQNVPTRLGPTGQPQPNPNQGLGALLPYRVGATGADQQMLSLLDERGVKIPAQDKVATAPTGLAQVTMTPAEQRQVEVRRGYLIRQNVQKVTSGTAYANASTQNQGAMLKRAISQAQTQAEGEMVSNIAKTDRSRLEAAQKLPITIPRGTEQVPITTP